MRLEPAFQVKGAAPSEKRLLYHDLTPFAIAGTPVSSGMKNTKVSRNSRMQTRVVVAVLAAAVVVALFYVLSH